MGSVIIFGIDPCHQLDFRTPGISPRKDISRKQIRQTPNFRRNPRGRPQREQRCRARTPNLGLRFDFSMRAFFAI
jgi:hypothetical protein